MSRALDCVIVGYNEMPFSQYERLIRQYGQDSEAYRDLQFSFVESNGAKLTYVDLLNRAYEAAQPDRGYTPIQSCAIPNLAAVYLTRFLEQRGLRAVYINLFQFEKDFLAECLAQNPCCVAITTTFYVVNAPLRQVTDFIRECNPEIPIVAGGPLIANHARSAEMETLLRDAGADIYVIEPQGEMTLVRLIECLKNRGRLADVPNLAWLESGRVVRSTTEPENNSLDENFIDWRAFLNNNLGPTIQTRTARSCAFKCAFCNYPARAGRLNLASLETIERELDSMRDIGYVQNVVFIDDTFNVPLPRFKDICRLMIRKKYALNWYSYFRCSNSDEEAIELMAQSGCKGVFLGIESGSPAVLKAMNKAATIEKYAEGISALRRHGILTFASFIIGFPSETKGTVAETQDFIQATKPDYYRAQLWYCEPGTPIHRERETYDISGEGFVWRHSGMESLEAMDHIEKICLKIDESQWLPQWSFDFWIIPYLMGRGISRESFRHFMTSANGLLKAQIAYMPPAEKNKYQQDCFRKLAEVAALWHLN